MSITNAEGKILIATPKNGSKIFRKSVIYVHTDDDQGSIGVLLNVPVEADAAQRFSEEINWGHPNRVYHGGPVERQFGYVLHSSDYARESSIRLNDHICYTGGRQIISDIERGVGPAHFVLVTGYCGWQPKQLEQEIAYGLWMVVDYDEDYFFNDFGREDGWEHAINLAAENKTIQLLDMVDTA